MLKELLRWRRYLPALVKAIREVLGEAEAYVFGSAVENKLTANSDIDVMIVVDEVPRSGKERARILSRLWEVMESSEVPWWYPFEIHIVSREEVKLFRSAKLLKIK